MAKKQSESPKERINITYTPKDGGLNEEIEVPFKMMVLGDYNPNEKFTTVEDRKPINVTKNNFNDVLKEQNIKIDISVPNKLSGDEEATIQTSLSISSMKDLTPENIVDQVDEMKKLKELRNALMSLKGPLGNIPAFRKAIAGAINNPEEAKKLLDELGIEDK